MTNRESGVIVGGEIEKEPPVRKGKAMLQIQMHSMRSLYRPCNLQGTSMPSATKAERFNKACLAKAGSSGYLGPGASMRILE